jgi:hypothetical protein
MQTYSSIASSIVPKASILIVVVHFRIIDKPMVLQASYL